MVIFTPDNSIWPYIQIYDKRTKRQLQNVLWYDTNTGEGAQAMTERQSFEHLGQQHFNMFVRNKATNGGILTGNFKDSPANKVVMITIPRVIYERNKDYIYTLFADPENRDKIILRITEEYIDKTNSDRAAAKGLKR